MLIGPWKQFALKAMALKPQDRYRTPKEIGDDVEKWLADERVAAYPESLWKRLKRWLRRHPAVAIYAVMLTMLAGVVVTNVLRRQEKDETERQRHVGVAAEQLAQQSAIEARQYRAELARSHNNLGALYHVTSRLKEAEQAYQDGLAIWIDLAHKHPTVADYRANLAASHNSLGNLYQNISRLKEAEQAFQDALAIQKDRADKHPIMADYAIDVGSTQFNLGNLMLDGDRSEAALGWYGQAIATLEPVVAKQPRHPTAKQFLRNTHSGRARALTKLRRYADAFKDWERALDLADERSRNSLRLGQAMTLAHVKEHAKATAEADALADAKEASADTLYDAACVYSLSSSAVLGDAKQAEQYAARAVALLRQAVAKGYKNVEHMKNDTDLDALRQREDFKKLIQELNPK
jgi:tetratricopeptide (TPR) repeat protein